MKNCSFCFITSFISSFMLGVASCLGGVSNKSVVKTMALHRTEVWKDMLLLVPCNGIHRGRPSSDNFFLLRTPFANLLLKLQIQILKCFPALRTFLKIVKTFYGFENAAPWILHSPRSGFPRPQDSTRINRAHCYDIAQIRCFDERLRCTQHAKIPLGSSLSSDIIVDARNYENQYYTLLILQTCYACIYFKCIIDGNYAIHVMSWGRFLMKWMSFHPNPI
jgi:hypothetical protein